MGILNVTPDSFSDGGQFFDLSEAIAQASHMVDVGVDIIDIGGQSSRPNAEEISLEEELSRVIPVIKAVRQRHLNSPISIDTTRAEVARQAIAAGADIINDISGGIFDPDILTVASQAQCPIILMHMRGTPKTMQQMTDYHHLIPDILAVLKQQIQLAVQAGIPPQMIAIDPGIGFAKTSDQNIELLQKLDQFQVLNCPILVGTSRKSFIGNILNEPDPMQRSWGTAATCSAAIAGGADILRVHDVKPMIDVSRVSDAIWRK